MLNMSVSNTEWQVITTDIALERLQRASEPYSQRAFVGLKDNLAQTALELAQSLEESPTMVLQSYVSGALAVRASYGAKIAAIDFFLTPACEEIRAKIGEAAPEPETQAVLLFTAGLKVALKARHQIR
jgi:hypothetical protein